MNGEESALQILMGADSLASFMTRLEFMKRTSEKDKEVINGFRDKIKKLNSTKDKLEKDKVKVNEKVVKVNEKKALSLEKKTTLQKKRKDYASTMDDLESKYGEVEDVVASLDKSSKKYKNYISDLEKEKAAADAEIDRILAAYYESQKNNGNSNAPQYDASGSWLWPVGNISCYISSGYGSRWGSHHGAIDIAGGGISGKPVYATKGGKVITSTTGSGSYWSYGNYILIDHGGGFVSLYAHLSSRSVSTGATVKKGQMIGRVGSTGRSTGPHLHFEIRKNGVKQNPLSYVRKP
jgi:murein DD-endopeptidase MepM/ murein hydrolase activator NlpD